ncbi:MOP flippase family protein [Halosquirtibacter xylanolyticus]|uniref:MOP flippase family protein n=1 Tax=Halosquirtibacter xylanolyticus TaxID=3374599 RepID=UPI003749C57D|nr:MOP flippase family protein [Prolixibacteraceae bacterium]
MLNEGKSMLFGGLKWSSINKIMTSIFHLVQVAVLARFLDTDVFGSLAIAMVVVSFTHVFVEMGVTTALLHKQTISKVQYSSLYWLTIISSLLSYFVLFLVAPIIAELYNSMGLVDVIRVLGLNLILISLGKLHHTFLQKNFMFREIFYGESISVLIGTVFAITLCFNGYGIYSLVYSTLIRSVVASLVFILIDYARHPLLFTISIHGTLSFYRIGFYSMATSLLDFLSKEMDIIILGAVLSPSSVGVYTLSKEFGLRLFRLINPVITSVLSPYFSLMQQQKEKLKETYLMVVRAMALINFPIYMIVALGAGEILTVFYGSAYFEGRTVLLFLSLAYAIQAVGSPVGALQVATGKTNLGFYWTVVRVIITPVVIYIGSLGGMNMVALSYFIVSLIYQYPAWRIMIRKMISVPFVNYLRCYVWTLMVMLISLILSMMICSYITVSSMILLLCCKVFIVLSIYAVLTYFMNPKGGHLYVIWIKDIKKHLYSV